MTAFTRIVIVLSFVRRALATQEIPPTQVILGLSLFLTFFVMGTNIPTAYVLVNSDVGIRVVNVYKYHLKYSLVIVFYKYFIPR